MNTIQDTVCTLYIVEGVSHWVAMLEHDGITSSVGRGNTPGEALDLCVKWAKDRGLFPCVDAIGFRVIKEDPRVRAV